MVQLILSHLIAVAVIASVKGAGPGSSKRELNYFEQDQWPETEDKRCGGKSQSPIDISSYNVVYDMVQVQLVNYDSKHLFEVTNNGHADLVTIKDPPAVDKLPQLKFKDNNFRFAKLHFHWGSNDSTGSEHLLDNRQYVLEMHLVHFNSKYKSLEDALDKDLGLLVFGSLFRLGEQNGALAPLANAHNEVADVEGRPVATETKLSLQDLLPGGATEQLYMYTGSLTTPPCTEKVQWLVASKINTLSKPQIAQFRQLRRDDNVPVSPNFRNVQPLNNRRVMKNF
ncbi:Carbonic anhydrase 6 [Halotydeus destructor]|nr:Carbonic anhydrase 6 [Halotydeus destructor]